MNTTTSNNAELQSVTSHFGLRYSPFTDTFPINDPFVSQSDAHLLDRMHMLLSQGKSFSLTGDPGSGKSMLLKTFLSSLESKPFRIVSIPYSGLKAPALLREICEKLSIDTSGRSSLLSRLNKSFSRQSEGAYPVIVLDEAHALPGEALLELFSLTHDVLHRTATASIILVGHPMLEKMLNLDIHSAIRTRIAARLRIKPLENTEVDDFIRYRLNLVKASTDLFTKEAMRIIELDTKGNRRLIMNHCGSCMDHAVLRNEKIITDELASEVGDMV
jgi:type II secretory pathway predicted ATPase ExeA